MALVTEFGTRITYRLKEKKYRIDTKEFWGVTHGADSTEFAREHLQSSFKGESRDIEKIGVANYFVLAPIERQVIR